MRKGKQSEWHNTNTGHDVEVQLENGNVMVLTEEGWAYHETA